MRTTFRAACLALVAALAAGAVIAEAAQRQPRVPPQVAPGAGQPGTDAAESVTPAPQSQDDSRAREEIERFRYRRPVFRLGQDYLLRADEVVRNLVVVMGDVTIEGRVEEDVVVVFGAVKLASTARIDGSFVAVGGNVNADEGARVRREVVIVGGTLTSPTDVLSEWGEQVIIGTPALGHTIEGFVPWLTRGLLWGRIIVPGIWWMWWAVGIFFIVYLVINGLLDRPVRASAAVLAARPLSAFLLGLLVLLLAVPVLAILAATVIGLAVVPFVMFSILAAAIIGKVAVMRATGLAILRPGEREGTGTAMLAFAIGFAILTLAYMVPVLGVMTWALTSVFGLGAASVAFRTSLRRERPAAPPAAPPPAPPPAPSFGPSGPAEPPDVVPVPAAAAAEASAVAPQASSHYAAAAVAEPASVASEPVPPPPPAAPAHGLAAYPRATFLDRVAAFVLDAILVAIANQLIFEMSRYEGMFLFWLLVYHIAFWAWRGTTLGGIIVSLRVVRTHGAPLRPVDAVVRGLSGIFSIAALGIGCFWMLQDPEKQMWHDKIAGTLVVKVPRDLVLP